MLPWLEALEDDDTAVVGICKVKSGGMGGMLVLAEPLLVEKSMVGVVQLEW
jgi:hypothetical protein